MYPDPVQYWSLYGPELLHHDILYNIPLPDLQHMEMREQFKDILLSSVVLVMNIIKVVTNYNNNFHAQHSL